MICYTVMAVRKEQPLSNGQSLSLCWAYGQIGALAVFATAKEARKYAGKKYKIYACEVQEKAGGK